MTKKESNNWIKNHIRIDTTNIDDVDGNNWHTRIYRDKENTGKLYAIDFLNEHPLEKKEYFQYIETSGKLKGFKSGGYKTLINAKGETLYPEPREVIRKSRMVEEIYYENISRE